MATDMKTLRIVRPHEISLEAARQKLEQTIGMILRTKNALWVFLKATKTSSLDFRPSDNVSLHFFAVANSVTDGRNIESHVENFVARVKDLFSVREINMKFLTDFLCNFMNVKIFGTDSERPMPLEMAVIEISCKADSTSIGITTIDYSGNSTYPDDDFTQIIFGCTDPDKQAQVRAKMAEGLTVDLNNEGVEQLVGDVLTEFPGDLLVWVVDFEKPTTVG